jgi:hypothetical protein
MANCFCQEFQEPLQFYSIAIFMKNQQIVGLAYKAQPLCIPIQIYQLVNYSL